MSRPGGGPVVALVGATGVLGREMLEVLGARMPGIAELRCRAGERSLGAEVEFRGDPVSVDEGIPGPADLRGVDLAILCAPPEVSREAARAALHARVPCIDCSGALAGEGDVPLLGPGILAGGKVPPGPALAVPPGPVLALATAALPLREAAGLEGLAAAVLEPASAAGREAVDRLSIESIALFNQAELEEGPVPEAAAVAFDCAPLGDERAEAAAGRLLARALGDEVPSHIERIRVPTFHGTGAVVSVSTGRSLDPEAAAGVLAAAPGLEVIAGAAPGTRGIAGSERVRVARIRADASRPRGLAFWLVADALRLAAVFAARAAEARLAGD